MVSAASPIFILIAGITVIIGIATDSIFLIAGGGAVLILNSIHFICVTLPPRISTGFEQAFGLGWEENIHAARKKFFIRTRTSLQLPSVPKPRLRQNVPFSPIPSTNRMLLCDLWQPPQNVNPSGLGFIYLHGSAFYFLDKDFCTRPFFSHLAAQGHVIMDVAYRLAPETDVLGMVHDVKRAIAWMKEHAAYCGVDANHIVLGGGSAGGHLALLTAYTADDPGFTPLDLSGVDTSVSAVVSLYGTSDMEALYYHTRQHLTTRAKPGQLKKRVPTKLPGWMKKSLGNNFHRLGFDKPLENIGTLPPLLGGHPGECPKQYAYFSPVTHVHANCPPTLLVHGAHDIMAPVTATYRLHQKLLKEKVPVVLHVLPQTDHGFDMVWPRISPSAHNAMYDVERFLALMAPINFRIKTSSNRAVESLAGARTFDIY